MARQIDAIMINARPEPISIELAQPAVVVVDMQTSEQTKGIFDRAGIDISPIQQVVAPIGKVLAAARRAGIKADLSQDRASARPVTRWCPGLTTFGSSTGRWRSVIRYLRPTAGRAGS